MKYKRIVKPIAFVLSVFVAILCFGCSVERGNDDSNTGSSGTDARQSEDSSFSEDGSSSTDSGGSSSSGESGTGKESSSGESSSSGSPSSSTGSDDSSDSGSGSDSEGDSSSEETSSDGGSSGESHSSEEGSSSSPAGGSSSEEKLFIEIYATGKIIRWNASEELFSFEVYVDGERQTHTLDKLYSADLPAGIYLIEVFGFLQDEDSPCRSDSFEYVVKISAPSLSVEEKDGKTLLGWNECKGADGYRIYKNGELMCDIADLSVEAQGAGEYTAEAYSSSSPRISSDRSSPVTVREKADDNVPTVTIENGILSFTLVEAKRYSVYYVCNGKEEVLVSTRKINEYSLKNYYAKLATCGDTAELFVKAFFTDFETRSASVFVNISDLV